MEVQAVTVKLLFAICIGGSLRLAAPPPPLSYPVPPFRDMFNLCEIRVMPVGQMQSVPEDKCSGCL